MTDDLREEFRLFTKQLVERKFSALDAVAGKKRKECVLVNADLILTHLDA